METIAELEAKLAILKAAKKDAGMDDDKHSDSFRGRVSDKMDNIVNTIRDNKGRIKTGAVAVGSLAAGVGISRMIGRAGEDARVDQRVHDNVATIIAKNK